MCKYSFYQKKKKIETCNLRKCLGLPSTQDVWVVEEHVKRHLGDKINQTQNVRNIRRQVVQLLQQIARGKKGEGTAKD